MPLFQFLLSRGKHLGIDPLPHGTLIDPAIVRDDFRLVDLAPARSLRIASDCRRGKDSVSAIASPSEDLPEAGKPS